MRLPEGVNTKPEHFVDGKVFKIKLVEFNPELRYSIKKIIKVYGLNAGEIKHPEASNRSASNDQNGTVLFALKSAGLWKSQLEAGKHDITCPWMNFHTDQTNHGTVYYEPAAENKHAGGFVLAQRE